MSTKYSKRYWVIHGMLTSERKASTLHFPIVIQQTLDPAARALKRQAPCRRLYMHSSTRQAQNASMRWVDAQSRSFSKHSTLLLERSSAKLLVDVFTCTQALDRLRTRPCVGSTRSRGDHMHDHSRFQRDIEWRHRRLSLSLSLPLTKVTDAQYRKRFRASYNIDLCTCQDGLKTRLSLCSGIKKKAWRSHILWLEHEKTFLNSF